MDDLVDDTTLRELCERYDDESRPVYLSLFADLSDPHHRLALERRAREVENALDGDLKDHFTRAWAEAKEALEEQSAKDGSRGVAVFCAPDHEFLQALELGAPIPTGLVLDSSPYVRPLAKFAHDYEPFLLVLLDSEDAAIFVSAAGRAQLEAEHEHKSLGRHRSGGMSQQRFQRHRDGVVDQFYDRVAQDALRIAQEEEIQRVIVAGPGQAKGAFVERLPKELKDLVIAVEDADFTQGASDPTLANRLLPVAQDAAGKEARQTLDELKAELRRGERATTGAFPVWSEAATGRVQVLVVLKDHHVAGQKCEEHQSVFTVESACHCGAAGARVDVINEAVEMAIRNKTRVEFVEHEPFLESVGGIGALLRW